MFQNLLEKFEQIEDADLNFLCLMVSHQNVIQRVTTPAARNGDIVVPMLTIANVKNVLITDEMISQVRVQTLIDIMIKSYFIPFFDYTVYTIFLTFLYNSFDKLWRKSKIWPKMWSRRICFRWWLAIGMWWIIRKPMLLKMGILWSWRRSLCLWRMCRLQIKRPNRFNNFP